MKSFRLERDAEFRCFCPGCSRDLSPVYVGGMMRCTDCEQDYPPSSLRLLPHLPWATFVGLLALTLSPVFIFLGATWGSYLSFEYAASLTFAVLYAIAAYLTSFHRRHFRLWWLMALLIALGLDAAVFLVFVAIQVLCFHVLP